MSESITQKPVGKFMSFYFLVALGITSCIAQRGGTTNSEYYEDLSMLRPEITLPAEDTIKKETLRTNQSVAVTPTRNVNDQVDAVLDSINSYYQNRRYVDGFTIQIYSGQNRTDAFEARAKMVQTISDLSPIPPVQYAPPKFEVVAGKYYTKLEAQKDLLRVRKQFPNAILIPDNRVPAP